MISQGLVAEWTEASLSRQQGHWFEPFFSIFANRYHLSIFDRLHQIIGPQRKNLFSDLLRKN